MSSSSASSPAMHQSVTTAGAGVGATRGSLAVNATGRSEVGATATTGVPASARVGERHARSPSSPSHQRRTPLAYRMEPTRGLAFIPRMRPLIPRMTPVIPEMEAFILKMRPFILGMTRFISKMRPFILGMTRPSARMACVIYEMEVFISKMTPFILGMTCPSAMSRLPRKTRDQRLTKNRHALSRFSPLVFRKNDALPA
jgi:hypothetical protein